MAYLLDTNVFIAAKNLHYGFDICPGFWDWLDQAGRAGTVRSVDAVYQELMGQGDDLAQWARDHRQMFSAPTTADIAAVSAVNRWATEATEYNEGAKADFAAAADSFLIGHARAGGHSVVTHEVPGSKRTRIKIPNAAAAAGVRVLSPFAMLRIEGARFELRTQGQQLALPMTDVDGPTEMGSRVDE